MPRDPKKQPYPREPVSRAGIKSPVTPPPKRPAVLKGSPLAGAPGKPLAKNPFGEDESTQHVDPKEVLEAQKAASAPGRTQQYGKLPTRDVQKPDEATVSTTEAPPEPKGRSKK